MRVRTQPADMADGDTFLLKKDPPHWAASGVAYLLILVALAAAVASMIIYLPETVSCPFVLSPVRGADPIRSSQAGIATEVKVTEGSSVQRDTPIFLIQSHPVGDLSAEQRALQAQLKGAAESIANSRIKYNSQLQADQTEEKKLQGGMTNADRMVELKTRQREMTREVLDRYQKTYDAGLMSLVEVKAKEIEMSQLSIDIAQAEHEREDAGASMEELRHQMDARRTEQAELERSLAQGMETSKIRISAIEQQLNHSSGDEVSILAPCSGTVLRLNVKNPGAVVAAGEVLSEIACSGDPLQAELTLPQSGVGLIKAGQGVKLMYSAFPYQRYGIKVARVLWVSPAASASGDGTATFRVFADIQDKMVFVRGQARPLMAGMGGNAQIVVGTRSLVSFLFEPIAQLRESFAEVPRK